MSFIGREICREGERGAPLTDDCVDGGLAEVEDILKRAEVGRIALSDGSNPYLVLLNFVYAQGIIAFHC